MSTLTIQKKISRLYRNVRQLTLAAFVLFILTICVRWIVLSKSKTDFGSSERENLYLPRIKNNRNGRPDLPKYIHLDLKGAPPKAEKFFDSFFIFLAKLQMGVKGVVIEYEDTLPLQGSLANVSRIHLRIEWKQSFRMKGHSSLWLHEIGYTINRTVSATTGLGDHPIDSNIRPSGMDT